MIDKMQTDGYIVINMEERIDSPFDMATEVVDKSPEASSPPKISKARHRASVACSTCRDRRIRCVVPPDAKECIQCKRSGVDCIIKNDDERRRPISRAYVCSLTDRIALLEAMLKKQGVEVPPANHPPKNRQPARRESSASRRLSKIHYRMDNQRAQDDCIKSEHSDDDNFSCQGEVDSPASLTLQPHEKDVEVSTGAVEKDIEFHNKSTVGPTRHRSTDDVTDQLSNNQKQMDHLRANTTSASQPCSMSLVSGASNTNLAPEVQPNPLRQNGIEHADGFMTTPGSDVSIWRPFLEPAPNLAFDLTTPSSTNHSTPGSTAWMPAECETSNCIPQLVDTDYLAFPALEETQNMAHLDFSSLENGVNDWEKAWAGMGFVNELGGFAAHGGLEMGFGGWMNKVEV